MAGKGCSLCAPPTLRHHPLYGVCGSLCTAGLQLSAASQFYTYEQCVHAMGLPLACAAVWHARPQRTVATPTLHEQARAGLATNKLSVEHHELEAVTPATPPELEVEANTAWC